MTKLQKRAVTRWRKARPEPPQTKAKVGIFTDISFSPTIGGQYAYSSGRRTLVAYNRIRVGSTVTWRAFTDSSGKFHPAVHGLVVESITLHCSRYGRHVRISASGGGFRLVEGNGRFFALEPARA